MAAQCWCDETTKGIVMDPVLAESVARRIAAWMDTAAQFSRNQEYYRNLLVECGKSIGQAAYCCDDGSVSEDVLCDKIPELVKDLCRTSEEPPMRTKG